MASQHDPAGLTDTNILIDAIRGLPTAVQFLADQRAAGGVSISIASTMELIAGCQDAVELAKVRRFLHRLQQLPLAPASSLHASKLLATYRLSHGIDIPDAFIAATALEHNLILYTRNLKHFQMIPGLKVVKPY